MINPVLLICALASFILTIFLIPSWIKKANSFGFVGKDMNKYKSLKVAEGGGIIVMASIMLGIMIYIAINEFVFHSNQNLVQIFALTTSLLMLCMIGLVDGSLGWKVGLRRRDRILLCLFAAIPLMVINAGDSSFALPFLGLIHSGIIYPLILIPLGIVATSTTFNFLAGFNGLEAGQGFLLIGALSIAAYFTGNSWLAFIGLIFCLALVAFLRYNFYPAKVFPGDVLTYPLGGMIGMMAIFGNLERLAVFFFIPYIIEVVLKLRGGLVKQSFAQPQKDESLELRYPKIYSLNHLAIVVLKKLNIKPTERRAVLSIWLFQIVIIILGFIIFQKGIFG